MPGAQKKLGPKYVGPYQVMELLRTVAYHLQLPENAHIHDVFHVDVLKPFIGTPPPLATTPALPPLQHGRPLQQPEHFLRSSLRCGSRHILVQWVGTPAAEAT